MRAGDSLGLCYAQTITAVNGRTWFTTCYWGHKSICIAPAKQAIVNALQMNTLHTEIY